MEDKVAQQKVDLQLMGALVTASMALAAMVLVHFRSVPGFYQVEEVAVDGLGVEVVEAVQTLLLTLIAIISALEAVAEAAPIYRLRSH